jgi:hypothetical protein
MPFYVYAIHTDHTDNRLLDVFDVFSDAFEFEQQMKKAHSWSDNYHIQSFGAANEAEAEIKADAMRRFPKLASKAP